MFDVVLYQPEIPPNTGHIIRLCAATGAHLHLIEPLGFHLDDKTLKRAGLDYHEFTVATRHLSFTALRHALPARRLIAFTTHGETSLFAARFAPGDVLLFGSETRGLPAEIHAEVASADRVRIPMLEARRSLNLSNAVAVALYEAIRQQSTELPLVLHR